MDIGGPWSTPYLFLRKSYVISHGSYTPAKCIAIILAGVLQRFLKVNNPSILLSFKASF